VHYGFIIILQKGAIKMTKCHIDYNFIRRVSDYMGLKKPRKKMIVNYGEKLPIILLNTGGTLYD